MSKEIYITSTPHETRLAIVEDEALTEIYYERENEYTLAGSIYNGRVTRVLPGMQSSFVDIGLERDAFLYITDFMEETPDPDEFDTISTGDRTPRAPRLANGDESTAPRTESAQRTGERSDRGDRGGRGRRGGRDRNPDRGTGERASPEGDRSETPRVAAGLTEASTPTASTTDNSELGEGAPGADGNRRWRGRRGRRRGRGTPGQPGDPAQENAAQTGPEVSAYSEDTSSSEPETYHEFDGAAETRNATADRAENSPRNERSSDRGRRNEGRGGQRRDSQRNDSPRRDADKMEQRPEQRTPRGLSPSRDLYGVDGGDTSGTGPIANAYPDENSGSAAEPMILPGESLSKYRKGDDQAASAAAQTSSHATPVTLAPPATLYTIPDGWDGGATLPGETLSRRRQPESTSDSQSESRRPQRDSDREPRRDGRPGRNNRTETRRDNRSDFRNTPVDATSTAHQPLQTGALSEAAHVAVPPVPVAEFVQRPVGEPYQASAASYLAPEVAAAPTHEAIAHVETEYEPADASASHRIDPAAPSEYRQSASTLEPPAKLEDETSAPSATHSITPAPGEYAAKLHSDAESVALAESTELSTHDITSISAAGEMFSEPVEFLPDAIQHPTPIETEAPTSPIRHEGAVVSADTHSEIDTSAAGGFAPGSGHLDEETLDDEDLTSTTLQASSIEEMDDLDEETLEGAADLGTMLREMSIDQITGTKPELEDSDEDDQDDEDDDLDEEDLDEEDEEDGEGDEGSQEEFQLDEHANPSHSEDDLHEQAARTGNAADSEFFEKQFAETGQENRSEEQTASTPRGDSNRDLGRDQERRGGRRDGRRGRSDRDRSDRGSDRSRSPRSGHSNGHGRHSMQTTNLPAISDLLKPGQEILVQIAKEPIAKKGARITSHIALPGRFLVFMPTVNHTGVSRKIESDGERRRLKEILLSEKGEATGGFIVRTAAEGASEEELRSDLRFLLNLWADIKNRSESSKSPALIYHDLNLIERILRDQVTDNFSAIWVDSEAEYERVLRFLQRFQPSLIRRVKLYSKDVPLFEQFGITEEINKALRSKVWLKSGGSIVIDQTEALVAIDINTGKFVGKTARLEDTIVKTNLDAIPEIVRQIRLRDLGGIIIIDFIDMDERKNRNRVMAALEDELKSDRAPSKVLQFNDFGLVAITRKRVKQSLERTLSTPCTVCIGTGMVKSPVTVCNDIYIEMRKMHKHLDRGDVMLRVHPEVVKQLKTSGAKWLQEMEEMAGKTILVKSDPSLHPEQFDIH